jgi:hypothetical protein
MGSSPTPRICWAVMNALWYQLVSAQRHTPCLSKPHARPRLRHCRPGGVGPQGRRACAGVVLRKFSPSPLFRLGPPRPLVYALYASWLRHTHMAAPTPLLYGTMSGMSRSVRKQPYVTDQQTNRSGRASLAKRQANRRVRAANKLAERQVAEGPADGSAFRKESCSWSIRDWSFYDPARGRRK